MWFTAFHVVLGLLWLVLLGLFAAGCIIAARHVVSGWHTLDNRQRRRMVTLLGATSLMLAGGANGVAFFTVSLVLGGDADKVEDGRYYVSSHGRFTEVSRKAWIFSDYHRKTTWGTSLLAALAVAVIMGSIWKSELARPSLTITIGRDGAILVDDRPSTLEEALARGDLAKARREPIYLRHAYPPDAVPTAAVKLHHEFIGHEILFQSVERNTH
jgi:hypothetical protein